LDEPLRQTVRAIVATVDGRPAGIVGLVREKTHGRYFSEFKEELEPHLRSIVIMRAIKKSLEWVEAYNGPVLAVAQHEEGARLMTRMGFTYIGGGLFQWLKQ
jgi:hypothetical protein